MEVNFTELNSLASALVIATEGSLMSREEAKLIWKNMLIEMKLKKVEEKRLEVKK